jgi:hypothetical protein
MVLSHRCSGLNLLNHLNQINKIQSKIEYIFRKNYTGPINRSISQNPYCWVCVLTINGEKQFINSHTTQRTALNKLLLENDKEIREYI